MIQPLRNRHRLMFVVLGTVLPVLFVAGLMARTPVPSPAGAQSSVSDKTSRILEHNGPDHRILIRVLDVRAIEVASETYTLSPDVLIYWSPDPQAASVSGSARLLGPLRVGAGYELPAPGGALIFHSVAHSKAIGSMVLGGRP